MSCAADVWADVHAHMADSMLEGLTSCSKRPLQLQRLSSGGGAGADTHGASRYSGAWRSQQPGI
jgi:hypothetical protein